MIIITLTLIITLTFIITFTLIIVAGIILRSLAAIIYRGDGDAWLHCPCATISKVPIDSNDSICSNGYIDSNDPIDSNDFICTGSVAFIMPTSSPNK